MNDKITAALFGVTAVGLITLGVITVGGDPEVDGLPAPPSLVRSPTGYYHTFHSAELPVTPSRIVCRHLVTRDRELAKRRQASGSFVGSTLNDGAVAECPASNTMIWGNPVPSRGLP